MAKIGIFNEAPQKYIQFDEDTEVLIRFVDKEELAGLIRKANEVAQKVKTPQNMAYDMFLGKKAVLGWRNIKDHNHPGLLLPGGEPISFTPENRNMLMTRSRDFSEFVFQKSTNSALFLESAPEGLVDPSTLEKLLEDMDDDDPKN